MSDDSKVEHFPSQMRDAVEKMKAQIGPLLEYQELMAQLHKAKYDALREQGFSDAQALELSKDLFTTS